MKKYTIKKGDHYAGISIFEKIGAMEECQPDFLLSSVSSNGCSVEPATQR